MVYEIRINYIGIIIFILFIIISLLIIIIISYFIFKLIERRIEYSLLYNEYNKKCKKILDEYGEWEIKNIYLTRTELPKLIIFGINILTLFQYDKMVKKSKDYIPYHTGFIFELKRKDINKDTNKENNKLKLILVEKNLSIELSDNYIIYDNSEIKKIKYKGDITLNKLLKTTQERVGNEKYFNWTAFDSNCQNFSKEILITLNKYNKKYDKFISNIKVKELFDTNGFQSHLFYFIFTLYKFIEKYLLDNNIFS